MYSMGHLYVFLVSLQMDPGNAVVPANRVRVQLICPFSAILQVVVGGRFCFDWAFAGSVRL